MNLHYGVQDSGIVEAFAEHDSCLKRQYFVSSGRLIATKYILHILKFYIFFCAVESISLMRFSWFTSLAPGS